MDDGDKTVSLRFTLGPNRCPRCGSLFSSSLNQDAQICKNHFCRLVLTGLELFQNKDNLPELYERKAKEHVPPTIEEGVRGFFVGGVFK